MLGYTPPKPQFWKALVAVAPIVALIAWSLRFFHVAIPQRFVIAFAVVAWLLIAAAVHSRVSDDWRAQYSLDRAAEREERP